MLRLLTILLLLCCAAPVWAVKLKLKAEEKDFDATLTSLQGDEVQYRKGRKDFTARLQDFELGSQFVIKSEFTGETGAELMELARFALHRGLYAEAQTSAARAAKFPGFEDQAEHLKSIAFFLEADAVLDRAIAALDEKDVPRARPLLEDVATRFAGTPAALKADVLLGTLKRVELEVKAAELEKEAQKAQNLADAEEQKRRQPIDDWLTELEGQVATNATIKQEADELCTKGDLTKGLPQYENAVKSMQTVRNSIDKNRNLLKYRGQESHADRVDEKARQLIIECYYRWALALYGAQRYDVAVAICKRGIEMDPKDRRFLSLKVDIDEYYDPTAD